MKPKIQFYIALALATLFLAFIVYVVMEMGKIGYTVTTATASDFYIDAFRDKPISIEIYDRRLLESQKRIVNTDDKLTFPQGEDDFGINKHSKENIKCEASYYDYDYPKGSGNWITKTKLVTAARDWPRGTQLKVTNIENGKSVIVKVTDYGPDKKIHPDRIVDLGSLAFSKIAPLRQGTIKCVKVEEIKEKSEEVIPLQTWQQLGIIPVQNSAPIYQPIINQPVNDPVVTPEPEPEEQTNNMEIILEIISPIPGKGLNRLYTSSPEVINEYNYIELGLIVRIDGQAKSDQIVKIEATDATQDKELNGTGNVTKIYINGVPKQVPYYPFHYEFKTTGVHVINFISNGITKSVELNAE